MDMSKYYLLWFGIASLSPADVKPTGARAMCRYVSSRCYSIEFIGVSKVVR